MTAGSQPNIAPLEKVVTQPNELKVKVGNTDFDFTGLAKESKEEDNSKIQILVNKLKNPSISLNQTAILESITGTAFDIAMLDSTLTEEEIIELNKLKEQCDNERKEIKSKAVEIKNNDETLLISHINVLVNSAEAYIKKSNSSLLELASKNSSDNQPIGDIFEYDNGNIELKNSSVWDKNLIDSGALTLLFGKKPGKEFLITEEGTSTEEGTNKAFQEYEKRIKGVVDSLNQAARIKIEGSSPEAVKSLDKEKREAITDSVDKQQFTLADLGIKKDDLSKPDIKKWINTFTVFQGEFTAEDITNIKIGFNNTKIIADRVLKFDFDDSFFNEKFNGNNNIALSSVLKNDGTFDLDKFKTEVIKLKNESIKSMTTGSEKPVPVKPKVIVNQPEPEPAKDDVAALNSGQVTASAQPIETTKPEVKIEGFTVGKEYDIKGTDVHFRTNLGKKNKKGEVLLHENNLLNPKEGVKNKVTIREGKTLTMNRNGEDFLMIPVKFGEVDGYVAKNYLDNTKVENIPQKPEVAESKILSEYLRTLDPKKLDRMKKSPENFLRGSIELYHQKLLEYQKDQSLSVLSAIQVPSHGDLHLEQLVLVGNKPMLSDWDESYMNGSPVNDLIRILSSIKLSGGNEAQCKSFIENYKLSLSGKQENLPNIPGSVGLTKDKQEDLTNGTNKFVNFKEGRFQDSNNKKITHIDESEKGSIQNILNNQGIIGTIIDGRKEYSNGVGSFSMEKILVAIKNGVNTKIYELKQQDKVHSAKGVDGKDHENSERAKVAELAGDKGVKVIEYSEKKYTVSEILYNYNKFDVAGKDNKSELITYGSAAIAQELGNLHKNKASEITTALNPAATASLLAKSNDFTTFTQSAYNKVAK